MDSNAKNQASSLTDLRKRYDYLSESWFRVERAIATGELRYVPPAFRVGGRRIYRRDALDRELSLRKFGPDDIERARKHRVCDSPLVARHLSPIEATPPPLGFDRAYQLAWQEHRALARINRPAPRKKLNLTASPPTAYEIDGSECRTENRQDAGGDQS